MVSQSDIIRFLHFCRHLGISPTITYEHDRIKLQKIFYILKKYGLELNFRFNWYKHGPYSPYLADVYYSAQNSINSVRENPLYFSSSELEKLHQAKKLFDSLGYDTDLLEYYASLIYVHNDMVFRKDERNPRTYENMIRQSKPGLYHKFNYKEHIINLRQKNLIPS